MKTNVSQTLYQMPFDSSIPTNQCAGLGLQATHCQRGFLKALLAQELPALREGHSRLCTTYCTCESPREDQRIGAVQRDAE